VQKIFGCILVLVCLLFFGCSKSVVKTTEDAEPKLAEDGGAVSVSAKEDAGGSPVHEKNAGVVVEQKDVKVE